MSTPFKPIIDITVLRTGRVLMVQFGSPPDAQSGWFLPNDLVKTFEHPDEAAARVLSEQLGVRSSAALLKKIDSFKGNDGSWHLAFHFRWDADRDFVPSHASITAHRWFDLDQLPPSEQVAHHGWYLAIVRDVSRPL